MLHQRKQGYRVKRTLVVLLMSAYIAVLLWAYATIISPAFIYDGYFCNWPEPFEMVWLLAVCLIPILFLPMRLSRPSGLIVWWLYATVFIPSTLLPKLSLSLGVERLVPLEVTLLACMAFLSAVSLGKTLAVPQLAINPKIFWPVILSVWSACLLFVCSHFNVSTLIANLASLFLGGSEYTIRNGFIEELSQTGRILGYTTGQVGEALNPFFIAYGLVYRHWLFLMLGVFGQLMIFAVLGAKSILFSTVFLVLVYVMTRRFQANFGLALSGLLIIVVLVSAGLDLRSGSIFASSITSRRTLMDPGLLTGFYFEHYSQVSHVGIGYHFGSRGAAVPAPSYEIGLVYFGDEHIDANANLWAEGFADFGIPGVFGFTLLLAGMMWVYDSIAARHNPVWAVLLVAMQAFALSNSPPLTVLLTHGGLASAFLLWCAPTAESGEVAFSELETESMLPCVT